MHSSTLARRIPRTESSGGGMIHRVAKSWTQMKRLGMHPHYWHFSFYLKTWIVCEITSWIKEGTAAAKSLQSCPTLCDAMDCSLPGFSVPGILQARTLEWGAISFSNAWKWKVKVKSLSRVWLLATPWTAAYQAPPSMGFSRQQYWSGVPLAFSQRMDRWKLKLLINSYQQIKSEKTKYGYMLKICSVASFMKSLNSI